MPKCLLPPALLLLAGCSSPSPKLVEGTSVALGAYIPWEGGLYGVELMSYVNGTVIKTPTNVCYSVERKHSVTNDWGWGLLHSVESTVTSVSFK